MEGRRSSLQVLWSIWRLIPIVVRRDSQPTQIAAVILGDQLVGRSIPESTTCSWPTGDQGRAQDVDRRASYGALTGLAGFPWATVSRPSPHRWHATEMLPIPVAPSVRRSWAAVGLLRISAGTYLANGDRSRRLARCGNAGTGESSESQWHDRGHCGTFVSVTGARYQAGQLGSVPLSGMALVAGVEVFQL